MDRAIHLVESIERDEGELISPGCEAGVKATVAVVSSGQGLISRVMKQPSTKFGTRLGGKKR